MQAKYDSRYFDYTVFFNRCNLLKVLGILLRMSIYELSIEEIYSDYVDFGVKNVMS
jgi:hypothetical protein